LISLAQGHAREQALLHNRIVTWVHTGAAAIVFAVVLTLILLFGGCVTIPSDVCQSVHKLRADVPDLLDQSTSAVVTSHSQWKKAADAVKAHLAALDQRVSQEEESK
jgi:hypothetical protein